MYRGREPLKYAPLSLEENLQTTTITIPANKLKTKTTVKLAKGQTATIRQEFVDDRWLTHPSDSGHWVGPSGDDAEAGTKSPVPGASQGCMIAYVRNKPVAHFTSNGEIIVKNAGILQLGPNDDNLDDNDGALRMVIEVS